MKPLETAPDMRTNFWKKRVFINTSDWGDVRRPNRLIYSWRLIVNLKTDATTVAAPVQSSSPGYSAPPLDEFFRKTHGGRGHGKVRIDRTGFVLRRINRVRCVVPGRPTVFTSRRDKHVPFGRKQNDISHSAWTEPLRCDTGANPYRKRSECSRLLSRANTIRPFPSVRRIRTRGALFRIYSEQTTVENPQNSSVK